MLAVAMGVNQGLAFLLELAMLAALGVWAHGAAPGGWPAWVAAIGIVAVTIAIWAFWAAPNASTRLPTLPLVGLKVVLFGGAAAGLWASGHTSFGIALALLVGINLGLAALWHQL